MFSRSCVQRVW